MHEIIQAVLGGIIMSLGTAIAICVDNEIVGAFIFASFLCFAFVWHFNLFSWVASYSTYHKGVHFKKRISTLLLTWFGNFTGVAISVAIFQQMPIGDDISRKAVQICEGRINDTPWGMFIMSVIAGFLMYAMLKHYSGPYSVTLLHTLSQLSIFGMAMAIWICGFEELTSDMFIFTYTGAFTIRMALVTIGNLLGTMIIPLANRIE